MAGRPSPFDFRLIVKCTRRCNYTCEYCLDRRSTTDADLDFANMVRIFHLLGQLEETKKIQIIWHGGEPLLRGIRFFEKMLFLQAEMVPPHVQVTHVLQTNGSLVDDEWASFFQACGFHLGISLDGPRSVQDANRPAGKRQSSYELTLNGISTLERHGVRYGLLAVANHRVLRLGAAELWGFFKEHGFSRFGVLSLRGNQPDPEAELDYNRRYGQFIVELMRLWLAEDDPDIQIREFRSKLDMFFGLAAGVCKDGGACVGKYYGIEPSGQVYHCDKFCSDSAWQIGHLSDLTFRDLQSSCVVERIRERETRIRSACEPCEWYSLCKGGCLADTAALLAANGRIGTDDCVQYALYSSMSSFLARSPSVLQAAVDELSGRGEPLPTRLIGVDSSRP